MLQPSCCRCIHCTRVFLVLNIVSHLSPEQETVAVHSLKHKSSCFYSLWYRVEVTGCRQAAVELTLLDHKKCKMLLNRSRLLSEVWSCVISSQLATISISIRDLQEEAQAAQADQSQFLWFPLSVPPATKVLTHSYIFLVGTGQLWRSLSCLEVFVCWLHRS